MAGTGPQAVITDFGELTPEPGSDELVLSALFPGVTPEEARAAVGWPLRCASGIATLDPPRRDELDALRGLHARTREAHRRPVQLPT
jgi:glutaconate CoA-transferase subunit B